LSASLKIVGRIAMALDVEAVELLKGQGKANALGKGDQ
jgi:hypothetical protein